MLKLPILLLVLEISTHDYGYQNDKLVAETLNGSQMLYRKNHRNTVQNIAMEEAGNSDGNVEVKDLI